MRLRPRTDCKIKDGVNILKAILVQKDKSLIWTDVENPQIKPDEILVKIHAAGVNRADLMQREGNYPPPHDCPEWMGLEISGVIAATGAEAQKKSAWRTGDTVCALLGGGGYAEYCAVRHDMLMPVPKGFTLTEAAALPEVFATAYLNLFTEARLQAGETLLMHAATSGLAGAVIPMAKAYGARVITTIRRESARAYAETLGADLVVNTSKNDIAAVLQTEAEEKRGVDIALDCLGGDMVGRCLPHVNYGARWIMLSALAGHMTQVDLFLLTIKNTRLIGSTLRSRDPEIKARILCCLVRDIWPLLESGKIKPRVCSALPVTLAEKAHTMLKDGERTGKVVLVMTPE